MLLTNNYYKNESRVGPESACLDFFLFVLDMILWGEKQELAQA